MAEFPFLGPIEHSVLEITLDGGHSGMTIDEEPLAYSSRTKDQWDTSDNDSLTATADENPYMNDFYQQLVSSEDENYFDSDNGSVTDIDGSMSEGEYCVVSDEGSMADLDVDRLDNVDYDDSDVWSVTDLSNCSC